MIWPQKSTILFLKVLYKPMKAFQYLKDKRVRYVSDSNGLKSLKSADFKLEEMKKSLSSSSALSTLSRTRFGAYN